MFKFAIGLIFLCLLLDKTGFSFKQPSYGGGDGTREFTKPKGKVVPVKPAVLIPGILGTQLLARLNKTKTPSRLCYKKADWFSIWLNLNEFIPSVVNCWVDNMRMIYHGKNNVTSNDGVEILAPNFGSTEYIEYLDGDHYNPGSSYFAPMVTYMMKELGYVKQENLFGAPYDWRFAIYQSDAFFANLTRLIEHASEKNNNQKVVLIAHSMGNLFTYYMLRHKSAEWKDKYIDSMVSISGPYMGALKSLKALVSGDSEGHSWILPGLKLRAAFRTMPSSVMMLPRPDLWPQDKHDVLVVYNKNGTQQNYTLNDYKTILDRAGCNNCFRMWEDNNTTMAQLEAPDVEVHCVYGTQLPTVEKLFYQEKDFPDGEPSKVLNGDGDRTVNVYSGSACMKWQGNQKQPVHRLEMPGNEHVGILANKTIHEYIKKIVQLT